MLASRPPLNCQKCQWRFFTDQGLERHLLGAHGLVTSNMQDMVDQNQDGGRCTICGRISANKLVAHMNQVLKCFSLFLSLSLSLLLGTLKFSSAFFLLSCFPSLIPHPSLTCFCSRFSFQIIENLSYFCSPSLLFSSLLLFLLTQ